ncbi:ribosome maturation factor RimP [Kushneria sinocarnis]|uniref:Ribosome maturation factor RimP n=1 Tax=Kushneria sinocarnis TaxID=595502 RepID=A0A420WSQ0_9GAMM|nr:ribosome maturation factor RimP [Kushneria sinocarnis]RKQ95800.1 ribosome maturation factor RimP [Kushneria sinocarnis]
MATSEAALTALIEPAVTALGFELWGIDYKSQGRHSKLVVYIDGENGVGVDDCADVSRQVSAVLDVEDPIGNRYQLEVSSPGLDRPLFTLSQFSRFAGHTVSLRLREPFNGQRRFKGLLAGIDDDEVLLQFDGDEYGFPIETIEQARIVPDFDSSSAR